MLPHMEGTFGQTSTPVCVFYTGTNYVINKDLTEGLYLTVDPRADV